MRKIFAMFAISTAMGFILSCNKIENDLVSEPPQVSETLPLTRAIGEKNLVTTVYVETNDVNPLNALDYRLSDGTTYFDIVELFASNIHKQTVGTSEEPTLYLNDKLTPVLENGGVNTYIAPLQAASMNVLLTVLGDWQGIGVANMNATQQKQFANILAWTVIKYGLDGIGFDDEYANYSGSLVSNSYGNIIAYLRELLPDIIITVFDWGNTSQISSSVTSDVDYIYHGYFGSYMNSTYSGLAGTTTSQWFPYSLNLGNSYTASTLQNRASLAVSSGYGGIMFFNLRTRNDVDPLDELQAIATGAGWGTVTCNNGNRSRDAGSISSGYTITNAMAKAGLAAAGFDYFNL